MLFMATTINYMDRQVITILKPTIEHSIGMSELDYSYVVDAFQIAYTLGLLAAGRFVDRVGTRIGYMAVMAIWSLSAMGHALADSVITFAIARFSLGLGESGNFPAAIKTVAEWFPQRERSLAIGIFNSGSTVGAVLAPLLIPWAAARFGWHAAFLVTGCFSSFWVVWWCRSYRRPSLHPRLNPSELHYILDGSPEETGASAPWLSLLGYRQTWAFAVGKFLTDPIWWFYLFWLPSFFTHRFHLNLLHLGLPLMLVYAGSAVGSIGGGWLPTLFRSLGLSSDRARLASMLLFACLVVPIFLVNYLQSEWVVIGLLSLAAAAHCGWSANIFALPSDMFPRSAVGSVTGIGGMAGSAGGILLATSTGLILQLTHSYASLFYIASGTYLLSFILIVLLAPGFHRAEFTPKAP